MIANKGERGTKNFLRGEIKIQIGIRCRYDWMWSSGFLLCYILFDVEIQQILWFRRTNPSIARNTHVNARFEKKVRIFVFSTWYFWFNDRNLTKFNFLRCFVEISYGFRENLDFCRMLETTVVNSIDPFKMGRYFSFLQRIRWNCAG